LATYLTAWWLYFVYSYIWCMWKDHWPHRQLYRLYRPHRLTLTLTPDWLLVELVLFLHTFLHCCLWSLDLSVWSFVVSAKQSPEESQEEEMELFKKLYIEWKGEEQFKDPQYKAIPRFYFKVPHIFYCDRSISCMLCIALSSECSITEKMHGRCHAILIESDAGWCWACWLLVQCEVHFDYKNNWVSEQTYYRSFQQLVSPGQWKWMFKAVLNVGWHDRSWTILNGKLTILEL